MQYIVIMRQWGSQESHSYILGLFSTFQIAEAEGNKESENRGRNKYSFEIFSIEPDKPGSRKLLLSTCEE